MRDTEKDRIIGEVRESLPATNFRIRLEDGREVMAYLSGKMRKFRIKIVPGDKVSLVLSPDGGRGRIVRRL